MKILCTLAILSLFPFFSQADEPAPPTKFYKLDFVVQEVEGTKVINSRDYSVIEGEGANGSIRAHSQVPVSDRGSRQTVDVGTNLDVSRIHESENGLALMVIVNLSSIPPDSPADVYPIVRANQWSGSVLVPLKKSTLIFSSDDVSSKHKLQLLLTATPIK